MVPLLQAVFVGAPRCVDDDEPYVSAFYKNPVAGPIQLDVENLAGDRQADLTVHGGPDKAVCIYSADHYPDWTRELGEPSCGPGWFGENFSVAHQTEETVSLGDVYQIGTALVQVSQPRGPCWKLGRRWRRLDMPKRVIASGRSGWYVRVLAPGLIAPGDTLDLVDRPHPSWTIAAVNAATYARGRDRRRLGDLRHALAHSEVLAASWRADLTASSTRAD